MVLRRTSIIFTTLILFNTIVSCSVVPRQIRSESEPAVPFHKLLETVDDFIGKTVILGGYILEVENLSDKTNLIVLQAPLSWGDEPKSKDLSEGRFIVSHSGFLDPEVYKKDRKITVAGNVTGIQREKFGKTSYLYLKVESRSLHLWPQPEYDYRYPYDYYWYYPNPYYRWYHPYYPYHRYYW
jgi:outer membrane lipoprotein